MTKMANLIPIRSLDEPVGFRANVQRHYRRAHLLMTQLEKKHSEAISQWPGPHDQPLRDAQTAHVELFNLLEERNHLSDSVRIYSALAAEGFLNLYGMMRLGAMVFEEHIERLGLVPKTRELLAVCDGVKVDGSHALIVSLKALADNRNALVHPKAYEVHDISDVKPLPHSTVPKSARDALTEASRFFTEFALLVPEATYLIPKPPIT